VNLNEEGEGDGRVVHAGLPVEEGEKIGLNIWPRRFFGNENGDEEKKKGGSWSGKWKE
jgi:prolyl 4-hydroxylase